MFRQTLLPANRNRDVRTGVHPPERGAGNRNKISRNPGWTRIQAPLLLAVLNADGKGKNLPDESIGRRIRALKGTIRLQTYVSLTCTNCPDIVQALNIMALLNPHITHEMIDGALFSGRSRCTENTSRTVRLCQWKAVPCGTRLFRRTSSKVGRHFRKPATRRCSACPKEIRPACPRWRTCRNFSSHLFCPQRVARRYYRRKNRRTGKKKL